MTIFDAISGSPQRHEPPEYEPEPTTPTGSRPGSREKLEEFRRRINAGEELWHPGDWDLRTMGVPE